MNVSGRIFFHYLFEPWKQSFYFDLFFFFGFIFYDRYADLLVHRLLAVAIAADVTYPELLDRKKVQANCNNLNYRHKMSQYAQRSSVALHTHLFFKHRVQDEDAYILSVRQNALQVLIPKYGLEGSIYLNNKADGSEESLKTSAPTFIYNPDVSVLLLSCHSSICCYNRFT